MIFNELDTVILRRDIAKHGLRRGDIGTVVHVHSKNQFEVEFVRASGQTQALVTLRSTDVREPGDDDLASMRSVRAKKAE